MTSACSSNVSSTDDSEVGLEVERRETSKSLPFYQPKHLNNNLEYIKWCLGLGPLGFIHENVILVALDTEFISNKVTKVTELGFATLDTNDIRALEPGHATLEWCKHIKSHHYRLTPMVKSTFLFGQSSEIQIADIASILASTFDPDRTYVLVGHGLQEDVDKITSIIGYDLRTMSNVVATVDTVILGELGGRLRLRLKGLWHHLAPNSHQLIHQLSPTSKLLGSINGISAFYFHNAGNDAFYTLHSLLLMATETTSLASNTLHPSLKPISSPLDISLVSRVKTLYARLSKRLSLMLKGPSDAHGRVRRARLKAKQSQLVFSQPEGIKGRKSVDTRFKPTELNASE